MADLETSIEGGVATLTLNRPDSLNALSAGMIAALIETLNRLATDDSVGAIVLTGAGRAFCAGGDVKSMAQRGERPFEQRIDEFRVNHQSLLLIRSLPKVVIGMINGPAFGAGLGLALACDLRIAGARARFGTAFAKIGFSGDYGSSYFLTQLVGPMKAREMFLLAEPVEAAEAARLGLVTRVVADDVLAAETMALAQRIAAGPRIAYGYMKRNLVAAETKSLAEVLDIEAMHQVRCGQTEDHKEARQAFVDKRAPVFRGR